MYIASIINRYKNNTPIIFFLNNSLKKKSEIINTKGLADFVNEVSYYMTWIACFGIWKVDFEKITDFNRFKSKKLIQVDMLIRLFKDSLREAVIVNKIIFKSQPSGVMRNYPLFQVFVVNYFFFLDLLNITPKETYHQKKEVLCKLVAYHDALSMFKKVDIVENKFPILWNHSKGIRRIIIYYFAYYIFNYFKLIVKYKILKLK